MAEQNKDQEKTERATPKKREEARKKGQVAKSRELASVAVLLAGLNTPGSTVVIHAELSLNPGDVNGDGMVDFADFTLLKISYGLRLGEPGYNPDADLDGSDKVDFADFTILKIHYGGG